MADIVKYEAGGQEIKLDPMTVRKYLVSGGNNVTDQEVMYFMELCKAQKLNPFIRDAYLVKYGSQAASIVVGKDAFTKRAEANPNYAGKKAGVIVVNLKKDIEYREGSFYIKGREELVGGWAKVNFKNGKESELITVALDEYNTKKSLWASKPGTMIRKVAVVQALREAFPNSLSKLYIEEEMGLYEQLPKDCIDPEEERLKEFHVDEPEPLASKLEKKQLMQLAAEKGLMIGTGKDADITKLIEVAQNYNINLKKMTSTQAKSLIQILMNIEEEKEENPVIQDVAEEDIRPVEEPQEVSEVNNTPQDKEAHTEADEAETNSSETLTEVDDPF